MKGSLAVLAVALVCAQPASADTTRAGYCASHVVSRQGQAPGLFLDLLLGQNTSSEWSFAEAVPAYEVQPGGALTCGVQPGFFLTNEHDGIYQIVRHIPPVVVGVTPVPGVAPTQAHG